MNIKKEKLIELCSTYFSDERILKRVMKRIESNDVSPNVFDQVDHYLDSIIYALEQLLVDRDNLEFSDLKWATFIGNAVDNIKLLLHLE